jgi:hypothetical protein
VSETPDHRRPLIRWITQTITPNNIARTSV